MPQRSGTKSILIFPTSPDYHAYRRSFHDDSYETLRLLEVLFEKSCTPKEPTRYDYADVLKRLVSLLKEMDKFIPGTYHKDAEIARIGVYTENFCHYEKIAELVESYLAMVKRVEELDFLLSILEQIKDRCEPGSRPYDIICSLLEANRPIGRGNEILAELKRIFKNGGALSDSDISDLNAMGFTYTPSRKHPKLRFHEKYMFVLPSTPSDTRRGGINSLKEIDKCIAVSKRI